MLIAAQVTFAVERTRAHVAAKESEERLRFALDAANMGTWDWDVRTQSVRWSDNVERIHGLPAGTFDSTFQSYSAEIHPEDRDRVFASIQRALSEGAARRGISHRRTRWHDPLGRGQGESRARTRRTAATHDRRLHERHAEEARRARPGGRARAIEPRVAAIGRDCRVIRRCDCQQDLDGTITSWNRGAERMFGFSAVEAIGQSITLILPPDRRSEEDVVLAKIRAGEPVEMETVRQRKDGSRVDISLTVSPVKDADGRIVGASRSRATSALANEMKRNAPSSIAGSRCWWTRPPPCSVRRRPSPCAQPRCRLRGSCSWRTPTRSGAMTASPDGGR